MWGAIVGDIIGSRFEFNPIKTTEFDLFDEASKVTDDSILTIATMDAILYNHDDPNFEMFYKMYVSEYRYAGYGSRFFGWAVGRHEENDSWGNGAAMRVSPIAYAYEDRDKAEKMAIKSAECSHNHPDAIKGAVAVTDLIMLSRCYHLDALYNRMCELGYDVTFTLDSIRQNYKMDESAEGTIPQAFRCVWEAKNYEEAIRLAVSLGGDADTLACIAGSIAEAMWMIPKDLKRKARQYLKSDYPKLVSVVDEFYSTYF